MKFFVVDDDKFYRRLTTLFLKGKYPDAEIAEAVNGIEARDKLFECSGGQLPDLILTDQEMPGLEGLGLIRAIRTAGVEEIERLKIVLLTGLVSFQIKTEAERWHCWFLQKPYKLGDLYRLLDDIFKKAEPAE